MANDSSSRGSGEWTRDDWVSFADRLLAPVRRFASPGNGLVTFPGAEGGYGRAVDGLEGFARTFLIAGFRIAGARGVGVDDLIEFYARGITTGVDPTAVDRWVRCEEHPQAKVEAASIALVLDLTRPWLWDTLDALTQQRVIDYLAPVVGDETYPRNNWLWFRVVVQTFLRSVGGPWSQSDIDDDLARHDSYRRQGGWFSDGDGRAFDHYAGWAMHLYPVLWARMSGADELAGDHAATDVRELDSYLQDARHLVGADGSPLIQGRSLIYRFAAAAPFWAGVIAGVPSTSAGALRHAAEKIVRHFDDRGAPNNEGVLTMGWHDEWRQLAQTYSGTGSPYWAAKGLLGIALPADHPVWVTPAEPLPVEVRDFTRIISASGWAVSGTVDDGIVRVANHGTSRDDDDALVGDSPLYARLGYSTAVSPLLDERGWAEPLEQSISLVDADGAGTHRSALVPLDVSTDDAAIAVAAASRWSAHLMSFASDQQGHGSGMTGDAAVVASVTAVSVLRGPWEIRLAKVNDVTHPGRWALRWGGWPVPANGSLVSTIRALGEDAVDTTDSRTGASPLAAVVDVPTVTTPVAAGTWHAVHITLAGRVERENPVRITIDAGLASISWPDNTSTVLRLPSAASEPNLSHPELSHPNQSRHQGTPR
ncbi:DUF2264 domain-containing protein [Paramicrobacterium chengjingii]|uniref:DUF2264 domain-containing protein n=1 Tax=Paramicrobacterium chengjingii TaxID=2769067 RepID=UPI001F43237F|nr:DUF2264 domain-containing protein [Microbacterium chengjingii]